MDESGRPEASPATTYSLFTENGNPRRFAIALGQGLTLAYQEAERLGLAFGAVIPGQGYVEVEEQHEGYMAQGEALLELAKQPIWCGKALVCCLQASL
jgi:hypothetical protein